jgi:hypothetical protein
MTSFAFQALDFPHPALPMKKGGLVDDPRLYPTLSLILCNYPAHKRACRPVRRREKKPARLGGDLSEESPNVTLFGRTPKNVGQFWLARNSRRYRTPMVHIWLSVHRKLVLLP